MMVLVLHVRRHVRLSSTVSETFELVGPLDMKDIFSSTVAFFLASPKSLPEKVKPNKAFFPERYLSHISHASRDVAGGPSDGHLYRKTYRFPENAT